ncbi:glycosyltransferase family 2 protein [Formosa algae]|uniref:glycosyltransferase family 2 protein n=1 Tax=Formosa algae TaxID=225843 RepID=UPI000CCECFAC|nr:glycosyltransferase family 2 protein [Formosa algae]PNW26877.1 hypothetical protein BKP44_15465 [Formosa algae]
MSKFKVSVIIPLYNASEFVKDTLDSVLNQTYENIEIIIIDDNSSDDSFNKASEFQNDNVILKRNIDKGACAARNYGFELSSGDYIQFLDADDILSQDKIEKQVEVLDGSQTELAVCNTVHFIEKLEEGNCVDQAYVYSTPHPEEFFTNLWGGNILPMHMIQTSAWLTPRTLIEKVGLWNEGLAKDQDGEFFARIGLQCSGIVYVPEIKNFYRKHNTGENIASKKQRKHIESLLLTTNLKEKYLFDKSKSKEAKKAISTLYKWVAMESWPAFPDLTEQALHDSKRLGGSDFSPVLGGKVIEILKNVFGWKFAKWISYYGHLLLKND